MKKASGQRRAKQRTNTCTKQPKKQITIRLDADVLVYFRNMSEELDMPYQNLINYYLKDCVQSERKLIMRWRS